MRAPCILVGEGLVRAENVAAQTRLMANAGEEKGDMA